MRLNPNATIRIEKVRRDIPVLMIDDFYEDADAVREEGVKASFDQSLAFYPGRHASISNPQVDIVKSQLCAIVGAVSGLKVPAQQVHSDFSLLTTRPSDLLSAQKHPHTDPVALTGIVYLTPHSNSGTNLFYNRVLDLHAVTTEEDKSRLAEFMDGAGAAFVPKGYQVDTECWEKLYTIEGKYNRYASFPGCVFHSIDVVDVPEHVRTDTARLTQRFLFSYPNSGASS